MPLLRTYLIYHFHGLVFQTLTAFSCIDAMNNNATNNNQSIKICYYVNDADVHILLLL